METGTVMQPPRRRLHELKKSADLPSEEFNHSIKTWVNMASLLVKQGNMAESSKDDENAYISYVRACIIITKIIPRQALYPTMMNDIVCIDLRQKILVIISRIGHLERRLLKRFEQENQERNTTSSVSPPPSKKKASSSHHNTGRKVEQIGSERQQAKEARDQKVEQEECIAEDQLASEFNPPVNTAHRHGHNPNRRRTMTGGGARRLSPDYDSEKNDVRLSNGVVPTLKKKSSNDDDRSFLLSPECQPNYYTMPSELFPRQREGGHVRRCSSADSIQTSAHFPTAYPESNAPAIPPRSEKRSSMWAPSAAFVERNGGNSSNGSNSSISNSNSNGDSNRRTNTETVLDKQSTAPSMEEREGVKVVYAREATKSRLSNRRTMSFESHSFNNFDAANTAVPKITPSLLRKSNSISKLYTSSSKSKREQVPPTPRLSVEDTNVVNGSGSLSSLSSTSMSVSSVSVNLPSSPPSPASSASSTPSASPQLKTSNPLLQAGAFAAGHRQEKAHKHSHSMTSITSGSAAAMADSLSLYPSPPSRPTLLSSSTSSLASTHSTASSQPQMQSQHKQTSSVSGTSSTSSSSSTQSPTLASSSTWSTSGKTAGLLRKIRSKSKVKDQIFEIMATMPSLTPSPSQLQQLQHQRQHSG